MIKNKKLYITGAVICSILIMAFLILEKSHNKTSETMSVIFEGEILGFAGAKNEIVEFYTFGSVVNVTDEEKEIQFLADSEKDVKTGLLKQSQLNVVAIEIMKGNGMVNENSKTLSIPANESVIVIIIFEGEYGGIGERERHPPENVQIVVIE